MQGSHRNWKAWKIKRVMEKSWNLVNWQKVMEFCDQSCNSTKFDCELYQISALFFFLWKVRVFLPCPQNVTNTDSEQRRSWKIEKQSQKSHGKFMGKKVVKSVGTL